MEMFICGFMAAILTITLIITLLCMIRDHGNRLTMKDAERRIDRRRRYEVRKTMAK